MRTDARSDLLHRARAGEPDAISSIYDLYGAAMFRVAFRLTASWADAQDVVQDVFVALPRALGSYEGRGEFEAWLVRLTSRTALMELRRRKRRREVPLFERFAGRSATTRSVDRIALDRAIALLPEEQREVFVLKLVEGFSHEEIAELLGISNGASRARLFRAVKNLKQLLEPGI